MMSQIKILYVERLDMEEQLAKNDAENMDFDYIYEGMLCGIRGYTEYTDEELEQAYNNDFSFNLEENEIYKIKPEQLEWDDESN